MAYIRTKKTPSVQTKSPEIAKTTETYDAIVIGSGAAGMQTALSLEPLRVLLLTKAPKLMSGSTSYAQGGMAAPIGRNDTTQSHQEDTLFAGAGLVNKQAAELLTLGAKDTVNQLINYGIPFDKDHAGDISLGREAAHTHNRILHAGGDATGFHFSKTLSEHVQKADHITVVAHAFSYDLIKSPDHISGAVIGVRYIEDTNFQESYARHVILATGGSGALFAHTTNGHYATADGMALAYKAGAILQDLEFVQFHPTSLDIKNKDGRHPLLTEALRGAGARLVNKNGVHFMDDIHPLKELAPRDIVARAVFDERKKGNQPCLDARHINETEFQLKFPTVWTLCQTQNLNPSTTLLPVTPAAHYHMGGVKTDMDGRTNIDGLWAVGEVACNGVHGANRLASNSLLECFVFAKRTANIIKNIPAERPLTRPPHKDLPINKNSGRYDLTTMLQKIMFEKAGLIRDHEGLKDALKALNIIKDFYNNDAGVFKTLSDQLAFDNMLTIAELIVTQALKRKESRGGHFRRDYPHQEEHFKVNMTVSKYMSLTHQKPLEQKG